MTKLPRGLSGADCVKALQKAGYWVQRQTGSHIHMKREKPKRRVSVPNHKQLKPGTLRSIIRQANMSLEEFMELL